MLVLNLNEINIVFFYCFNKNELLTLYVSVFELRMVAVRAVSPSPGGLDQGNYQY